MDEDSVTTGIETMLHVAAYGRTIAVERNDTGFALPYLPVSWSPGTPVEPIDRRYTVLRTSEPAWDVSIDGELPITLRTPDAISEYIEGDLHHWLATYTRGYLFVHAGCVSWRDRAIVIPGRSHAGKTTLTRALLEAGATYYSDDYAVIDPTGAIHPFPRMLRVRPDPPGPSQRVDPMANDWPVGRGPVRAALVAALSYDAETGWNVETLTRGMGALSLLDNTVAARERPQDALRLMSTVMSGAIAIKGTRDDAASAADRLIAMVDDVLDGEQ